MFYCCGTTLKINQLNNLSLPELIGEISFLVNVIENSEDPEQRLLEDHLLASKELTTRLKKFLK